MTTTDITSSQPDLCQFSPVPALPAPLPCFPSVSTALADTAMDVDEEQPPLRLPEPVVAHPVLASGPLPVSASHEDTAMDRQQEEVAEVPRSAIVAVSVNPISFLSGATWHV